MYPKPDIVILVFLGNLLHSVINDTRYSMSSNISYFYTDLFGDFQLMMLMNLLHINTTNTNNVYIGQEVSGSTVEIGYDLTVNHDITTTSDKRLKENISNINNPVEKVKKLRGVNFSWKADAEHKNNIGFIAQEVQEVVPELVKSKDDGFLTVNYQQMVALLAESMKEQQQVIETLQAEVTQLKKNNIILL